MFKPMSLAAIGCLMLGVAACQTPKPEPINVTIDLECCCYQPRGSVTPPPVVAPPIEIPAPPVQVPVPPPDPDPPKIVGGIEVQPVDPEELPEPPDVKPADEEKVFFGVEIKGRSVLCIDISGSMRGWRMDRVKSEAKKVINALQDSDAFALIIFGGNPPVEASDKMVMATEDNKRTALDQIDKLKATGDTPAKGALERACTKYGDDVNQIVFLTDGAPTDGAGGEGGSADLILMKFPKWFEKLKAKGCKLRCIRIGDDEGAEKFLKDLANQNGGTYTSVDK